MIWNRGIRVFFRFARWGKSKKRVLNAIGRPSSTRLLSLLGITHPKWCYETEIVEFDRKRVFSFRLDGESRKNAFWTQLDDLRQPVFYRCLEKPKQNNDMKPTSRNSLPRVFFRFARWGKSKKRVLNAIGRPSSTRLLSLLGIAHPKWWYETDLVVFDRKGVFSFRPDGESRKNAFWTQLVDFCQPGFLRCLEKPTQNGGMKPKSWNSIARVFFRFASMGKVEKTRFKRNWTTFVNPPFWAAWKSPPKMVVWNRNCGIRSQGCFFVSPRWGKSKNAFWTQLDDLRQPGFYRCLE